MRHESLPTTQEMRKALNVIRHATAESYVAISSCESFFLRVHCQLSDHAAHLSSCAASYLAMYAADRYYQNKQQRNFGRTYCSCPLLQHGAVEFTGMAAGAGR